MPNYKAILYTAHPKSHFHFGMAVQDNLTALNQTDLIQRSDSMYGALVSTFALVDQSKSTTFANGFDEHIRISSLYYCFRNKRSKDTIYFLPKPTCWDGYSVDNKKLLKRTQFISKGIWESCRNPMEMLDSKKVKYLDKFACLKDELDEIEWKDEKLPEIVNMVTLPKVHIREEVNRIYYASFVELGDNGPNFEVCLYFLYEVNGADEQLQSNFKTAVQLLTFTGIGGERSSGNGQFLGFEETTVELSVGEGNAFVTSSITIPSEKEQFEDFLAYKVLYRGGRRLGESTGDSSYLKAVPSIEEGALVAKPMTGMVADIGYEGENSYRRFGKCFSLPINTDYVSV